MASNRAQRLRTAAAGEVDPIKEEEMELAMDRLEDLQDTLEKVTEQIQEKIVEIKEKYNEIRRPVYLRRNDIIMSIPDFWLTTFSNHPTLGDLLTEDDKKILKYLDCLFIEEFKDPIKGYCITFNFKDNPYFENEKLAKTIKFFDEGTMSSRGTIIKWKKGKGPAGGSKNKKKGNKRRLHVDSFFFSWLGHPTQDKVSVKQDMVAKLIREDIWPNPIKHLNNGDDDDGDTGDDEYGDYEDGEDEDEDENQGKVDDEYDSGKDT